MQELLNVTGMILRTEPIGEYDRRVLLLTKERGKIAAFAKGARKQGSRFLAATNPFCFGEFGLYVGRSSYSINEVSITNYFEGLREDFVGAYYGMYFLEVMDFFTQENNDEKEMLKLLYQSLRALQHPNFDNDFVRYIFEIKAIVLNGEYPGIPEDMVVEESTKYAMQFIVETRVEKLFTFSVTPNVNHELRKIAERLRKRFIDRPFKSLEILRTLQN